ncbi:MAG: hypothetical protein Q8942_18325 [Bacillota bacterium]|nr:hypothetical protein [Bacillota bacterium]
MSVGNLLAFIIIIWVCFYNCTYGVWTWKNKNKLGAIMIFILGIAIIALPVYVLYFRRV